MRRGRKKFENVIGESHAKRGEKIDEHKNVVSGLGAKWRLGNC
jgi:hypothetical protein